MQMNLPTTAHAGAEAQVRLRRAGDNGRALHIEGAQAREGWRGEGGAGEVRDVFGQIAHAARSVEQAKGVPGPGAEAEEFHVGGPEVRFRS